MSDDASSSTPPPEPAPRRSGRDRSSQNANTSASSAAPAVVKKASKSKMKAASPEPVEEEDQEEEEEEEEVSSDSSPDEDSGEEFSVAQPKKKTPNKRASIGKGKGKGKAAAGSDDDDNDRTDDDGTPKARRTRAPANKKGKGPAKPKAGKGKKKATAAEGADPEEDEFQEGADVKRDNVFFNALLSGKAFDPIIEDWVEQFEEDEDQALGELVVFLLRSSGSSAAVTPAEAVDVDGIVSQCDDIEKEKSLGAYPLISKQKSFKRFHPALTSFLSSFLSNLSTTPHLYSSKTSKSEPSPIIHVFQSWLFSLCSSRLRSFRHTATVIALETMTALCEVAAEVRDELGTASRQREQERKKVAKGGAGESAAKERLKELEKKVKEVHWKKGKLEGYLTEIFNTVFVMRYRDTEALIRTVCVKELGVWMKTLPDVYLESAYFKYVGWMLDDINSSTRLETVKALSTLYADQSNASSLSSFTERFKRRLLQMAFHDIELSVRTTAIGILNHVDRSGMLDDEKRRQVGLLVFDSEGRVRKAVAGFFEGRWEEERDEMLEEIEGAERRKKKSNPAGGRKKKAAEDEDEEVIKARVGWKCLASMFVRFSHALDDASAPIDADETMDDPSAREAAEELKAWVDMAPKGRIGSAVESLWDKVDKLRDCEGLVDFLGLDHSADDADDEAETDGWKLDEDEEGCLLQVLVAGLRKVKADAEKKDDSTVSQEMTRILIKALPKLIAKHQSDVPRLADILNIPHLMTLEMYLDLRMVTAFEGLWDDLTKVFLKNSEPVVLGPAVTAMNFLMSSEALANTNAKKYAELEDALFTSLRTVVAGRDVETAGFNEDDVATLTSVCMRIGLLYNYRDLGPVMDEDEGGKQSSGWAILLALASRGSLGYKEEGKFVDHALETLNKYVLWRTNGDREDSTGRADLIDKRGALLEKLEEFAVGTQSNAVDIVRRTAFNLILSLYVLFNPATDLTPVEKRDNIYSVPDELKLVLDEQVQFRCSGFMQAEIEKYAEEKVDLSASQQDDNSDDDASDDEEAARKKKKLAAKKKEEEAGIAGPNEASLTAEHRFISTVGSYLIALRVGVLDIEHCATVLTHHGRFGLEYDALCKIFVEDLRQLACYGGSSGGASAAKVVVESLKDSFVLFTDGAIPETELISLAKLFSSALVVHGPQFKITKRMDSRAMVTVHTDLLDWLARKIAEAEKGSSKAKKLRNALTFFKALVFLAGPLDGKESMKIQTHLKDAFAKYKIEVSTTKIWDHERAYEKKLTTTMSKDPKIANGARQQVADAAAEDAPAAAADEDEARPSSPLAVTPANARPKRGRPAVLVADSDDEQPEEDDQPAAKRPRPKPKARTAQKEAEVPEDDDEDEPAAEVPQNMDPVDYEDDVMTKRPREDEEEAEDEPAPAEEDVEDDQEAEQDGAASPPSKPASSSSQESVVNTGRKKRPRRG